MLHMTSLCPKPQNRGFTHPYPYGPDPGVDDVIGDFLRSVSGNGEVLAITADALPPAEMERHGIACVNVTRTEAAPSPDCADGTGVMVRRYQHESAIRYSPEIFDGLLIWTPNPLRDARDYLRALKPEGMVAVLPVTPHAVRHKQWTREFPIELVRVGPNGELMARKHARPVQAEKDCAFCPKLRFRLNRLENLPGATGVLWGDADFLVMPDLAPLTEGHVLVVTVHHAIAMAASGVESLRRLNIHLRHIDRLFRRAYGVGATFFEHGPRHPGTAGSCIDHAHVHALPARVSLLREVCRAGLEMETATPATLFARYAAGDSYLFVQEDDFRTSQSAVNLPSQLMRRIYTEAAGGQEWRWQRMYMTDDSRARFLATLNTLLPLADSHSGQTVDTDR